LGREDEGLLWLCPMRDGADAPHRTVSTNPGLPGLRAVRLRRGMTGDYRRDPDTQVR